MRITLDNGKWVVKAQWLGAERTIYSNIDVFACIKYAAINK